MKKTIVLAALMGSALGVFAQGTVNFTTFTPVNAPVTNILNNQRVAGTSFLAQLYWGPAASADDTGFISVTNAPRTFGTSTTAGFILSSTPTFIPTATAGGTVTIQMRAWEAALGANWEEAYANWQTGAGPYAGKVLGKSNLIQVKTGDPTSSPPGTPAGLTGLRGFYLTPVPEPGVIALGVIGLAALLWRRRK